MTDPEQSAGEAVPNTISIDPAVALHETVLMLRALEAHYRNRNLVLAQNVHDLTATLDAARDDIAAMKEGL